MTITENVIIYFTTVIISVIYENRYTCTRIKQYDVWGFPALADHEDEHDFV